MTVTRVRSAITEALKDKRITPAEARKIANAAETTATGKKDKVDRAEAELIGSTYAQAAPNGPVKLGEDARKELNFFFTRNGLPYGPGAGMIQGELDRAIPASMPAALKNAPDVSDHVEIALTPDQSMPQPPYRTAMYDFVGKTFFIKEKQGSRTKWFGPFPNAPAKDPDAAGLIRAAPELIDAKPNVAPGNVKPTAMHGGFKFQGSLLQGQKLDLKLSNGKTVHVSGPALRQSLVNKINDALPKGFYASGSFVGGTWFEDMIHEVTPREGDFVIRIYEGQRPGGPLPSDLPKLRRLKENLTAWKKTATVSPLSSGLPKLNAKSDLYQAANGDALITVWLAAKPKSASSSRAAALVNPRTSEVYFASLGGAHEKISAPIIGPAYLQLQPSGRFFTWDEIRKMAALANR